MFIFLSIWKSNNNDDYLYRKITLYTNAASMFISFYGSFNNLYIAK